MKELPPEQFRITSEIGLRVRVPESLWSDESYGMNGAFFIPRGREILRCIVSDQGGWEHVSVSLTHRCPTWDEMSFIKGLFWDDEEAAFQFHPKRSEYVNYHPFCLHIWRPTEGAIQTPPSEFVGPKP